MLISIPQSTELHANHRDEVYLRVGDKSKKLNFDERLQLIYSKGARYYENEPVYGSEIEDIDLDFVSKYCSKIGYPKSAEEYIRQNGNYLTTTSGREELSGAAVLLFGKEPQRFFERARVRFIRYDGTEAKVGAQMNVIKDKIFTGRILDVVEQSIEFVRSQIKEHTYLGKDGRFVTEPEYPEFAWKELIVNAVAHRDYSIKGTDIQIKMFDDHLTVESPGTLPGTVRISNMRQVHFSRNPKIAQLLHEYEYVREFGEGIDRMFSERQAAGLPEPEYRTEAFMLLATIKNSKYAANSTTGAVTPANTATDTTTDDLPIMQKIPILCVQPLSREELMTKCGLKNKNHFIRTYLKPLLESGQIKRTVPDKPNSRNQKYIKA